eukprot:1152359-Pelagomonas_calceolata.AAC.4
MHRAQDALSGDACTLCDELMSNAPHTRNALLMQAPDSYGFVCPFPCIYRAVPHTTNQTAMNPQCKLTSHKSHPFTQSSLMYSHKSTMQARKP